MSGPLSYRVTHETVYEYDDDVTDSYGLVHARPREMPTQHVTAHSLTLDPATDDVDTHEDSAGNTSSFFHVTTPHRRLVVRAVSEVEVHPAPALDPVADVPWEQAVPALRPDLPEAALAIEYVVPSPAIDQHRPLDNWAATSFEPGRPLVEAVLDLVSRVHTEFEYTPGSTTLTTQVAEVMEQRKGVCQDFAHLMIAALRGRGLAARYVSGYLSTDPPPGKPRLVGVDATHAWLACWVPEFGWLAVDPTNDCVASNRHITVAWGRDYADVPPVKGVIFTEATTSTMAVTVDVAPLP